jgi:hypothetical protein
LTNGKDEEAQADDGQYYLCLIWSVSENNLVAAVLQDLFPIEDWPVFQPATKDGLKYVPGGFPLEWESLPDPSLGTQLSHVSKLEIPHKLKNISKATNILFGRLLVLCSVS